MTSMAYIINVLEEAEERNQKLHRVVLTGMKNKHLLNKKYTSFNKSVKQVKCEEKKVTFAYRLLFISGYDGFL